MCKRSGYTAPCREDGCTEVVTCRRELFCPEHDPMRELYEDD